MGVTLPTSSSSQSRSLRRLMQDAQANIGAVAEATVTGPIHSTGT